MKRYLKVALSGLGVLLIAGLLYSQVGSKNANDPPHVRDPETERMIALVRGLYAELGVPDEELTCRLDYTVKAVTIGLGDSLISSSSDVSYAGNRTCVAVASPEMSLFQDTIVGISIVPSVKEIQVFASTPDELRKSRLGSMQAFQAELFNRSVVRECRRHEETGEWRMVLEPEQKFMDWYHVKRVEIVFNPEERRIRSIHSEFDGKVRYVSMTLIYNRLECSDESNERGPLAGSSVLDKVFTPGGALRSEYHGFEVIDHRIADAP